MTAMKGKPGYRKPTAGKVTGRVKKTSSSNAAEPSKPAAKTPKKQTFSQAFAAARKAGKKEFTWNGKKYHTRTKEEDAAKKKAESNYGKTGREAMKPKQYGTKGKTVVTEKRKAKIRKKVQQMTEMEKKRTPKPIGTKSKAGKYREKEEKMGKAGAKADSKRKADEKRRKKEVKKSKPLKDDQVPSAKARSYKGAGSKDYKGEEKSMAEKYPIKKRKKKVGPRASKGDFAYPSFSKKKG